MDDPAATARRVIDANDYLVLATADGGGVPWATPVYYKAHGYSDFYWVSSPGSRHSLAIAQRPEAGIAIFDSHAAVGRAEAVYIDAEAVLVAADQLDACLPLLAGSALGEFGLAELTGDASFRLYRARAIEHSVLLRGSDPRNPGDVDTRLPVKLGTGR